MVIQMKASNGCSGLLRWRRQSMPLIAAFRARQTFIEGQVLRLALANRPQGIVGAGVACANGKLQHL